MAVNKYCIESTQKCPLKSLDLNSDGSGFLIVFAFIIICSSSSVLE